MSNEDETISTLETESYADVMDVDQTEVVTLSMTPKNLVIGTNADVQTTQVCASMKAAKLPEDSERAPVDILVALDVSYSMQGDKLELSKKTLELLLRHLLPKDRFGLVSYSDDAQTEVALQYMNSKNKDAALKKIKALHVIGSTNISAAISLAFQELKSVKKPNKVQSCFLLTDGHANRGIEDHAGLVELTRNCARSGATEQDAEPTRRFFGSFLGLQAKPEHPPSLNNKPISMFCFGYGNDHNAALLRDLSDSVESGSYYHVEDDSDVGSAFGDAMGGLLSVLAQSAVLTIRPGSSVTINEIHHDRVLAREDGSFTVNVGDFFAEEERDIMIEASLAPNPSGDNTPMPHLHVSLAYTDVIAKKPVQSHTLTCSIARPVGTNEVSTENTHVAAQWLRVLVVREMEASTSSADRGNISQARERLSHALDQIRAATDAVREIEMVRQLEADLVAAKAGLTSRQQYQDTGSKFLQYKSQAHRAQRSAEDTTAHDYSGQSLPCYTTSSKRSLAQKFKIQKGWKSTD